MAAQSFLQIINGIVTRVFATVTGGTVGDDGKIVALDASGRLDSSIMPSGFGADTLSKTAGEGLAANDIVGLNGSGNVVKASAASGGVDAIGFVKASVSNAATATVFFSRIVTGLSGLTPGARYYLSAITPGALTLTPPTTAGQRSQFMGTAASATELVFEPDSAIAL